LNIFESLKNFLAVKEPAKDESSEVPLDRVINNFENLDAYSTGAFFDDNYNPSFTSREKTSQLELQRAKIMLYRNLSKTEDVFEAIDEIVNEIIYSNEEKIVKVQLTEDNNKIQKAIEDAFDKIYGMLDLNKNLYSMVRQSYIDGQIVLHCAYGKNLKDGIKTIKQIEPVYFYFDSKSETFKYLNGNKNNYLNFSVDTEVEYQKEEIIRNTFGIADGNINLGYLEYAVKASNQLRTLEDLLIPLRFSRSISRRVFNVDTGELSPAKSEAAMTEMSKKFRYKKFYNTETGEITNQQHITSMVEDYWFANRSGGRGTTVDVLDETGNLGEVNDILYFQKKLYKAMKIPLGRIASADGTQFDYESSAVTHDEMKFFTFISRIRSIYTEVFKELLRRELVSTGVMTADSYDEYKSKIRIIFSSENMFLEKMKIQSLTNKLEVYATVSEYAGKLFPVTKILKDVFKMTDEEIDENFKQMEEESQDQKFNKFYVQEDV